jgi:hypothetical protein
MNGGFSVVDIVFALTESVDSKDYWYRLKVREKENSGVELSTFCRQLKLISNDGKLRDMISLLFLFSQIYI